MRIRFRYRYFVCVLGLVAACNAGKMYEQPRFDPFEATDFFADGTSARHLVEGTVARGAEIVVGQPQPPANLASLADSGHEQFEIFCSPCHAADARGNGKVVQHGYPAPPSLFAEQVQKLSDERIFEVISHGFGMMLAYGPRVQPQDRWAIAAYLRRLWGHAAHGAGQGGNTGSSRGTGGQP